MNGWVLFLVGCFLSEALAVLTIRAVRRKDAENRRRYEELWKGENNG